MDHQRLLRHLLCIIAVTVLVVQSGGESTLLHLQLQPMDVMMREGSGVSITQSHEVPLYCPGGKHDENPELKQNIIQIGLLGCHKDPLMLTLTSSDLEAISGSHCGAPGYQLPTPEYMIAILYQLADINNSTSILPYHKVCVAMGIDTSLQMNLNSAFFDFVHSDRVVAVIDALEDEKSLHTQNILLSFAVPVMRFSEVGQISSISSWTIVSTLKEERVSSDWNEDYDDGVSTLFTTSPEILKVYEAILKISQLFGWKRIGVVLTNIINAPRFIVTETNGLTLVFSFYDETDPLESFRVFIQYEIRVFVFHGTVKLYLDVLKFAADHYFVGRGYVWIFPYSSVIFPDDYVNLWCNYTQEEAYTIKNALRGSLSIGIIEGFGEAYDNYTNKFATMAEELTGDGAPYEMQRQLLQTAYVHDTVGVLTDALSKLVETKASQLNVPASHINITSADRNDLTQSLLNASYNGLTGHISFTRSGKRYYPIYAIRNFVPVNNTFQENNSLELDPWVVQIRGCLVFGLNRNDIQYIDENGMLSTKPTIIYADGTNMIPPDRPNRIYIRSTLRILISTISISLLFMITLVIYLMVLARADQKALLYNDNWIYKEDDCHFNFTMGQFRMNKCSWLPAMSGMLGVKGIGQMRTDGTLVYITKAKFDKTMLTAKVRQEVKGLRELNHCNICPFIGCILDNTKSALLYEYCTRGSLRDVLNNANFQFDWMFRLSFALDAAKGMLYLHSKKFIHGRLKSTTCVIDDQWTLRITDYGLEALHKHSFKPRRNTFAQISASNHKKKTSIASGVCLLESSPSQATDIYSYGVLLKELAATQRPCLGEVEWEIYWAWKEQLTNNEQEYDENTPKKFIKLIDRCMETQPHSRPSFTSIQRRLERMSPCFLGNRRSGVLQIYSRKLEEALDETLQNLYIEKERHDELLHSFIPRAAVNNLKKGQPTPFQEHKAAVIICVDFSNAESLLSGAEPNSAAKMVSALQKSVDGVTSSFEVQRVCFSGSMWVLASGIDVDAATDPVVEAANVAVAILDAFHTVSVPTLLDFKPAVRIGLHAGTIMSGVLEQPIPQNIVYGKTVQTALQLMLASQDMKILASQSITQDLKKNSNIFALDYRGPVDLVGGKSIPAFWVNKAKHSTALHSQTSLLHQTTLSSRSRNQSQSSTSSQLPTSYGLHSKSSTPGLYRRSTTSYDLESGFQLSSSCWTCQQHHGRKTSATKRWRSTSAPVLSG